MPAKKEHFGTLPSLVSDTVYLRPASPEDIAATHHWYLLAELENMADRPMAYLSAKEASEAFKQEGESGGATFMIVRKNDKRPVGRVSYENLNSRNRSAEVAVIIDPDERERGYGKEGLQILCRHLFLHQGLNKVYGTTPEENKSSVQLMESLGFKKDGVLRDNCFYQGEFHNALIYSLLRFELDW